MGELTKILRENLRKIAQSDARSLREIDAELKSVRTQDLRNPLEAKALAPAAFRSLPPASSEQLNTLKVPELRAIATRMQLEGRSKPKRKADVIKFLCEHKAPLAPSYEQLLNFWVEHR